MRWDEARRSFFVENGAVFDSSLQERAPVPRRALCVPTRARAEMKSSVILIIN